MQRSYHRASLTPPFLDPLLTLLDLPMTSFRFIFTSLLHTYISLPFNATRRMPYLFLASSFLLRPSTMCMGCPHYSLSSIRALRTTSDHVSSIGDVLLSTFFCWVQLTASKASRQRKFDSFVETSARCLSAATPSPR